jgi:hypothetical protein
MRIAPINQKSVRLARANAHETLSFTARRIMGLQPVRKGMTGVLGVVDGEELREVEVSHVPAKSTGIFALGMVR